jgi:hypothetical protein
MSTIRIAPHLHFVMLFKFFLQKYHYFVFNLLLRFDKIIRHSKEKREKDPFIGGNQMISLRRRVDFLLMLNSQRDFTQCPIFVKRLLIKQAATTGFYLA